MYNAWQQQNNIVNYIAYIEKTPIEMVELMNSKRDCWSCLKVGHWSVNCNIRKKCSLDGSCNKYNHESLHQAHIDRVTFHATTPTTNQQSENEAPCNCLLQLMRVRSGTSLQIGVNILRDGGATISLITICKARDMDLIGEKIKFQL